MRGICSFALAVTFSAAAARAQDWEAGFAGGYGIYRNASVYAPAGKVTAGVRNRFVIGAVVSEELYEHLGGEIRYVYHDGDPFLSAAGVQTNVQGQSHAVHYDLLIHLFGREQKIRPFMAVGGGLKDYVVSGPAPLNAPFGNIASLGTQDDLKPLFTVGPGVKIRLQRHAVLRFDFRDYVTPFPKKLISAAPNGTTRGLLQQFTFLAGISYVF